MDLFIRRFDIRNTTQYTFYTLPLGVVTIAHLSNHFGNDFWDNFDSCIISIILCNMTNRREVDEAVKHRYFGSILVISSCGDWNLECQRVFLKFEHNKHAFLMTFCSHMLEDRTDFLLHPPPLPKYLDPGTLLIIFFKLFKII